MSVSKKMKHLLSQQGPIIALIGLWLISFCLVNIGGEFALIDDWAYSKSVRDLSEFGVFKIYDRILSIIFDFFEFIINFFHVSIIEI